MRNFDNWTCYRDLKGKILCGCVQFNVNGGNTPAPIFDRNGTAIANPQITDILGRTQHQVFIDEDVTAYFYKYVGNGTIAEEESLGIDTSDVSRWALQFTCDNVLAFGASFDSISAMEIGTMSDLRAIDPESVPNVGGVKEIILGGYYEAGDCEQVRYIWDANSTESDDNGSIIKCNDLLTGRWLLVTPTEHCDSRHFGVFPQPSAFTQVDHSTRIAQLVAYCNKVSIRPFFNGSDDTPFFIYSFLNVICKNAIDVSEGTKFEDKDDSSITAEFNGNPLFQNGNTDLVTKKCRTSWKYKSVTGYSEVIIDEANIIQKTYSDAKVSVLVPVSGFTFNSCVIESHGNLGDNTFSSCELKGTMFGDDATSPVVDDGCVLKASDFSEKMPLWCKMRALQTNSLWDCESMVLDNDCVIDGIVDIELIDAFLEGASINDVSYISLIRCAGTASVSCDYLNISNSNVNLDVDQSVTVEVCYVEKSDVLFDTSAHDSIFEALDVENSSVISRTPNKVIVYSDFFARDSVIAASMEVHGDFIATRSEVNSPIVLKEGDTMYCDLTYCEVNEQITLSPSTANTIFSGSIVRNHGSVVNPIVIDRTNFAPADSSHTYIYQMNDGTFIKDKTEPKSITATVHIFPQLIAELESEAAALKLGRMAQGSGLFVFNRTVNFDTAEFFRIGTDSFDVNMEIVKFGMDTARGYDNNVVCGKATLEAVFVSGFTWGLRVHLVDPSDPTSNVSYNTVLTTTLPAGSANTEYAQALEVQYENLEKHI